MLIPHLIKVTVLDLFQKFVTLSSFIEDKSRSEAQYRILTTCPFFQLQTINHFVLRLELFGLFLHCEL